MALKFDRSKPGVWVSGAVHAAVLATGLFAFESEKFPDAQEGIPVEIVTDNMVSEITRGEQSAKEVQPQPKPRAERVAVRIEERDPGEAKTDAPTPPKRPVEAKVDDKPAEAAAPPTPPLRPVLDQPEPAAQPPRRPDVAKAPEPPRREPEKKPEPPAPTPAKREELAKLIEREDAEAQAKAQAAADAKAHAEAERQRAEAERQKAEADARAKAAAEAQAKVEAERKKALAEAKAKAEAKVRAEAKAKAEAEAKAQRQADLADKFDAGDIRKLLASREPSQSSGATGREVNRTASLGTATGNAQRLNPSQRDALIGILQEQLHKCWVVPVALQSAPNPPVPSVRVKLNPDGSLGAEPAVMNRSSDQLFGIAADSALRATRRCAPLRIPAQFQPYYQDWKDLVVNFNLRDMG